MKEKVKSLWHKALQPIPYFTYPLLIVVCLVLLTIPLMDFSDKCFAQGDDLTGTVLLTLTEVFMGTFCGVMLFMSIYSCFTFKPSERAPANQV